MNPFDILASQNYWETSPPHAGITRDDYLDFFKKTLHTDLIKILIGQRRVGKSYILRQIIHYLINEEKISPKNIIFLNFEYEKNTPLRKKENFIKAINLYQKKIKPQGRMFFFFDEIQELEEWEKITSSFLADYTLPVDIFITGSNAHLLSSELATYITGRYISKNIYPFSYFEYLKFFNAQKGKKSFLNYIQSTGLPEMYHLPNEEIQYSYIHDLKNTIITKDIIQRYKISQIDLLEKIFLFLIDNIGNLFSLNSLVKKLNAIGMKTNTITLGNYLKYLESTFLIFGTNRFDMKGKKILEGQKKYYINDLGFRNFFSSSFDTGLGKHLENYVARTAKQKGYSLYIGNIHSQEIDFILEKPKNKQYIQVCHSLINEKVSKREYSSLQKTQDNWKKSVLSLDEHDIPPLDGIQHIKAWELENQLQP